MTAQDHLAAIKVYISKMPSLPTTVTKIMEICNDPATSPADLNKVISLDPVLMGKVMKLINSAYYGLSQEVTSLVRAIIMLGLNTVKNLALSTAVLGNLGHKNNFQALNMEGFWRHSLCVGVTSKLIARKRGTNQKFLEEYFMAGLLHDIGKIPLNNKLSDEYMVAISYSDRDHQPLYMSEKQAMEVDHTEVGRLIVDNWKLGPEIQEVVSHHHDMKDYNGEKKDIVYTVIAANYFANSFEIGFSGDRFPAKADDAVFNHLGINVSYFNEIEELVNKEIEKASIFLKLAV
ncbi:MAG: HDOD domain-containing protein [Spirochaetota bacterium]